MIKALRFLLVGILAAVLLIMLSTDLTYIVAVNSTMNRALTPTFLIYKDLLLARPGHRRPTATVINQTMLLSYSAIELGELEERQQIRRLLDSNIGSGASSTSSWSTATQRERQSQESFFFKYYPRRYAEHWTEFCRALRSWVQNKRFDPQVMAELGDLVKTPLDRHYNATGALQIRPGQPYRSCAVVGNSGILLHKTHGSLIDSHEMVIRLNNAHTRGFEDNVGSKTSLAFINSNILHTCARRAGCFCHAYGENVPIIMYMCQAVHFMDFALCNASLRYPLLVTDARFDKLCGRVVKYYSLKNFVETTGKHPDEWSAAHEGPMFHYSSGMQAVMLALGICEKVSLFGFGKSPQANHHYHTRQKRELTLHDYEAEYQLYYDLAGRSQEIPFLSEAGIELPQVQIYV